MTRPVRVENPHHRDESSLTMAILEIAAVLRLLPPHYLFLPIE